MFTYPDLHLVLCLLTLHGQILLLYFLHQFLVDCQTEGCVKNAVLLSLKPGRHLVLEVLWKELSQRITIKISNTTLVTPSISFWSSSHLASIKRVSASLKRTSRPSQRKLSSILEEIVLEGDGGRTVIVGLLTCWRVTRRHKK